MNSRPEFPLPSACPWASLRNRFGPIFASRRSAPTRGESPCRISRALDAGGAVCRINARTPRGVTATCPVVPNSSGATKLEDTCAGPCWKALLAQESATTSTPARDAALRSTHGARMSGTGTNKRDHCGPMIRPARPGRYVPTETFPSPRMMSGQRSRPPGENPAPHYRTFFITKPTEQGTGLGLAICLDILFRMNGSISLESTPGQGTTFRVRLPLDPQA